MPGIIPDPNKLRFAQVLTGRFLSGMAVASGVDASQVVAIAGARLVTIRGSITVDGTLAFFFLHPDGVTRYTVSNPSDVTVTAGTEFAATITSNGEASLEIVFTPSDDGAVDFVHVCQL